jgi:hypothetical protein
VHGRDDRARAEGGTGEESEKDRRRVHEDDCRGGV